MKFRADIEGIRGLAITLVVLCHASVPGFAGGFIGVDVFFVLSGFLITGILAAELKESARIDFFAFYARRMRRLLPAFAAMFLAIVIACNLLLPSRAWLTQAQPLVSAAAWLSNFYFAFAKYGYFGSEARDSAVLHTWSLGVEEQFYLIWPLVLLLAWRWLRGRPTSLSVVFVVATIVGFVGCLVAVSYAPIQAYYLMPSRLWELTLGASAFFLADGFWKHAASKAGILSSCIGALAIATGIGVISDRTSYPGFYTLLPTFGTFALLLAGTSAPRNWVTRTLESSVLTFLGRISYSWYLWHWPVLMIGRAYGLDVSGVRGTALIGLSLGLACASYFGVELPTRRMPIRNARRLVASGLVGIFALVVVGQAWVVSARSIEQFSRLHPTSLADRIEKMIDMPGIYRVPHCDDWYNSAELVPCRVLEGDPAQGTAVIFGDSVGAQWYPGFLGIFRSKGMSVIVITKASCPMIDKSYFFPPINRMFTECDTWRGAALDYLERLKPRTVILGSSGGYDFSTAEWREGTRKVLSRLTPAVAQTYILAPTPILPFDGPGCLVAEGDSKPIAELDQVCTVPLKQVEREDVIDALRETASTAQARFVYLNDLVCPSGICRAWQDGKLVYRDSQHLNGSFVAGLATEIESRMPGIGEPSVNDTPTTQRAKN